MSDTNALRDAQATIDRLDPSAKPQRIALAEFLTTFDAYTLSDVGPHLTCGEVEALADLFRAFDRTDQADALIEGHAAEDDEGDDHYRQAGE